MKGKKKEIQWHPAFRGAVKTELEKNRNILEYEEEKALTKKELRIDLLVVKKLKEVKIENAIGHLFRKCNIIEYKSPTDYVSIDDFYKVMAYAYIYKSDADQIDEIKITEMTITFICNRYPIKLVKHLKEVRNYKWKKYQDGIYYIEGDILPIQIIVSKRLDAREHKWLKVLTDEMDWKVVEEILKEYRLEDKNELKDVIVDTIIMANEDLFQKIERGGVTMSGELLRVMEPFINKKVEEGKIEGRTEGRIEGKTEGKIEGRIEGKTEGKYEIILKLYEEGMDVAFIAKVANFTKEEVEEIVNLSRP